MFSLSLSLSIYLSLSLYHHRSCPSERKDIPGIARYYGPKIAYNFAFRSYFTSWLVVPSILGLYHLYEMSGALLTNQSTNIHAYIHTYKQTSNEIKHTEKHTQRNTEELLSSVVSLTMAPFCLCLFSP